MAKNKFRFLSYSGFYITTTKDKRILIDPFLDDNEYCKTKVKDLGRVDLLLITHAAFDHYGDSAKVAKMYGSKVVCDGACALKLKDEGVKAEQIIETTWGLTVGAHDIKARAIENHHRSSNTLSNGINVVANPLAFIVYLEDGTRVYIAGDTAIFSDMKLQGELYRPHIGLINVCLQNPFPFLPHYYTGEMTPYEAALASHWLALDTAVACHYNDKNFEQVLEYLSIMEKMNSLGERVVKVIHPDIEEEFEYSKPV
jgi:L-ascorbate metabolism protein UlaG (beta-lactamase superfamily)